MPIKKKRPKPTGIPGIKKDGPNRFLVCVTWTDPKTGRRRKREAVAESMAEAVQVKEELKGAAPTQRLTRERFADYAEQWMKIHGPELALSTKERYAGSLAHATVSLGEIYTDSLEPSDVQAMVSQLLRQGYAKTTVNSHVRVLRRVMDDLLVNGVLAGNPARAIRNLPEGKTQGRRGRSLPLEEFRRFITTVQEMSGNDLSEDIARLLLAAAWTGMRRGEILAVKWEDYVDGEIRVERAVYRRLEKTTETDDPRRIVVVEPLAQVLAEQRQWLFASQHPGISSGLIFPANPRQAMAGAKRRGEDKPSWHRSPTIFHLPLLKVVKEAKITDISGHSLRRTWENLLRKADVDVMVRRSLAGWRTEAAQSIYATVAKEEREAAGRAVVAMVQGVA